MSNNTKPCKGALECIPSRMTNHSSICALSTKALYVLTMGGNIFSAFVPTNIRAIGSVSKKN